VAEYPLLKFCPQCGSELKDQQAYGRVRRYCLGCERVIFRDPKVAAAVLIVQDGRLLLVCRGANPGKGKWSMPAGFVDHDEEPAATAVRECWEETGLEVELTGIVDVIPGSGLQGEASFTIVYQGEVRGGQLAAGDDAQEVAFFSLDDLPPLAFDSTRQALKAWQDGQVP